MQERSDLPIVILAAGQSRRMRGRDKLLEAVDGRPLLLRQVEIARAATTGAVIVTLPDLPHRRYDVLSGQEIVRVPVPDAGKGISASLRRGLLAVPGAAGAAMVMLADLPELTTQDLGRVLAAAGAQGEALIWRGATETGAPGHPIVFAKSLFPELMQLTGDKGGAEVVARHRGRVLTVSLPGNHARLDLDTPEDWENWRSSRR